MKVKKLAATSAAAAALSAGALGFGSATAQADPDYWWIEPPPPGQVGQLIGVPPGHVGQFVGVPPGHWDKPWKWLK
ncbi:hypothetical protein MARA_11870 [Mycolicibacterium arabiense]|uniref:Uncharacterized protein n=1 Tax=Mycolicibacterium arabiense TaxID=1286181 RepID=A0A7I7RUS4_9MYCO|nr:hypothetical protein [Mycolicibacterium arabiense]MCV7373097.1 hypothetical protein [Mycolicibacterium arabiense]BBY47719.1 hypothetical protein MARA_11870 [Mycolicibacterium arabiense]